MIRFLAAASILLCLPPVQESPDQIISGRYWDAREIRADFEGYGQLDHEKGTGRLTRVKVKFYTKPRPNEPSHTIRMYANRCELEGIGESARQNRIIRFFDGLRIMIDDSVRLWTPEGTFDTDKQVLKCPKNTRLVQFEWPTEVTVASLLAFMDPQEVEWLKLFGAPDPDFELAGDEFEFDAAQYVFTAGKNGRLRVRGSPGAALRPERKAKKRAKPVEPTELRSEGPLVLRNLGAPSSEEWSTLHVTGERNVVIERLAKETITRATCDAASFYLGLPPSKVKADPRPLSALLTGKVRIAESSGFETTCDHLEWNHQDGLLRLIGKPVVEMTQGGQKLVAKEVVADPSTRAIDFKGDIAATFRPGRDAAQADPSGSLMTLRPGDLRIRTDASGRPIGLHAWNGVRITSPLDTGDEAIDAEGTEFEWDLITGEGLLRGSPFARLSQGQNFIVAPLLTFQGESFKKSLMVVKGPKVMKFFNEMDAPPNAGSALAGAALGLKDFHPALPEPPMNRSATLLESALGLKGLQRIPGREDSVMDLTIACDGDAVLDQVAGTVKLVDRCRVRHQDSTLFADRLFVELESARGKKGLGLKRVLGHGNVRATRPQGPKGGTLLIEGETLEFRLDPAVGGDQQVVTIVGYPKGRFESGAEEWEFDKLTINLDDGTLTMHRGAKR